MTKARDIADYGSYGSNPNVLINGSMVINQRGVVISAASVGEYGPDRWKRTAGGMTQIVEEGNFKPSTVYTLSGDNVTEQQVTSPASGHWTLPDVPITATNIKLEEGIVATPYQLRNKGEELSLCERYFEIQDTGDQTTPMMRPSSESTGAPYGGIVFRTVKRVAPTVSFSAASAGGSLIPSNLAAVNQNIYNAQLTSSTALASGGSTALRYKAEIDAEL